MKLHKGEEVVCPQGHRCGFVRRDVQNSDSVTAEDIACDPGEKDEALHDLHDGNWTGYVCLTCGEQVARLQDKAYTVYVATRGWVS